MREMNKELKKDRESKKSRSFFSLATIFGYYGINIKMQVAKKVHENKQKRAETQSFLLNLWSECGDLNSGPLGPEPSALPAALHPGAFCLSQKLFYYSEKESNCQAKFCA